QKYKGSPKAFIAMKTARQLWSSRFGTITAIRFPAEGNDSKTLTKRILSAVEPADAGFTILETGSVQTAAAGTTDFSGLVTGLSFFLIAAALILAGMVYSFALQRRLSQLGILSAAGFTQGQLFVVFVLEHGLVVLPAVLLGIPAGMIFTKLILVGLNSIWASAAGGLQILFSVRFQTLLLTALISIVLALIIFGWKLRGFLRRPAVELLNSCQTMALPRSRAGRVQIAAIVLMLAAGGLALYGTKAASRQAAMMFFAAGACLLAGLTVLLYWRLASTSRSSRNPAMSLLRLALNNASRRKGRSLAVVTALAMGVFVVVSVSGFQKTAINDPTRKDSGSGGFTIWAQSSIPVGRKPDAVFLHEEALPSVPAEAIQIVSLRQYSEEEASCLNLARTQRPIVWGVMPEQLAGRFHFKAVQDSAASGDPFELLNQDLGPDVVPAIGDYATVYWSLHKRLGEQLDYLDQDGRLFHLHIVGLLDNSSLQGGLLISEKQFLKRFRSQAGWNVFLVQTPLEHVDTVAHGLTRAYESYGMETIPTVQRLARFSEVENTYIAIFMALGSLGLLLGSVGLGLVVLLNVLDRAGELAMMRAMGFEKKALLRMILIEHAGLLAAGLICGVISAIVAAGPQLSQAGKFPWLMMAGLVAAMAVSGLVWVGFAVNAALRGELLEPLRNE
ncbi:MAG: ABC transporter permease, partial [Anaerohalosphaeraceae bacterium]